LRKQLDKIVATPAEAPVTNGHQMMKGPDKGAVPPPVHTPVGPTIIPDDNQPMDTPVGTQHSDQVHHVFCYAALADKHTNTLYIDATGTFPYQSLDGN